MGFNEQFSTLTLAVHFLVSPSLSFLLCQASLDDKVCKARPWVCFL